MPMLLHGLPLSPFVRKVLVFAHETGLIDRITLAPPGVVPMTPVDPDPNIVRDNPLGKIPALVLDDGTTLYDSRVICEVLDGLHDGAPLFPPAGAERWTALRRQTLADGINDAAVLTRYETALRPEALRWERWTAAQKAKVARALDALEAECAGFGERLDIGTVAVACALGYLDFRFTEDRWRERRLALAAWYAPVAERPSMVATRPEEAA
jgi:glutathione S-transferase